jgi:signal transduction histidine kinase
MSIRLKVILPYLLLTVVVSVIGVYVVTRLVSATIQERLTNQLLEAGRVVSDGFVRQEIKHVEIARIVANTNGLANALDVEDRETLLTLAEPAFVGLGPENLILISPQGHELVHLILDQNGAVELVQQNTGAETLNIVLPFLTNKNVEELPHRSLGMNLVDQKMYYYTAIPVSLNGKFAGVVVVGTSIHSIIPLLKSTSLADVIVYGGDGRAFDSTLGRGEKDVLSLLTISPKEYEQSIGSPDIVKGNTIEVDGRSYSIARGPLQVGNDRLGVFAVALPLEFVVKSGTNTRTTYVILFTVVFFFVLAIGFVISRLITTPIYSLVKTSLAITGGDLEKRTGIRSNDEIGTLASTFDEMTARLQERTQELEQTNQKLADTNQELADTNQELAQTNQKLEDANQELEQKNKILKNIDKTKTNFIQISAHELRTPLTLIMGYSQMLEQDTQNSPELLALAQGILEGSERMTGVVDSMLDVSRIDSNTLFLRKTELSLDLLINKVNRKFESAFEERNIKMSVEGLAGLPLIPADPDMLQKVFYQIIMNAIKFTPDGGSITVSGASLNGSNPPQVQVSIRDTGIGIDSALHHLIFDKFNQTGDVLLHSSGKTKFKGGGPGLGLAIARGIVEAHGGSIWVESPGHDEEKNPGSTFFVRLPVERQVEKQVEKQAEVSG